MVRGPQLGVHSFQWEHIFANPMATAAAIDRVVHHSVILEFDVPSYRTGVAQQRSQKQGLAKVALGVARRMGQGHEHLPGLETGGEPARIIDGTGKSS